MHDRLPIAVVTVRLEDGLRDVRVDARHGAAYVVTMLHGAAVGVLWMPVRGGVVDAAPLADALRRRLGHPLARRLAALAAFAPPPEPGRPAVSALLTPSAAALPHAGVRLSVAVCTRDRPERLAVCLRSLAELRSEVLEVVVVDNAPGTERTRELLAREFPDFRYEREDTPGLNWARNRAVAASRGDVIAFVDDDTVVDAGWAAAVSRAFAWNPDAAALTGLVLPYELETEAQLLFESNNAGFGRGFARRWVRPSAGPLGLVARHGDVGTLGTGANMAFRRATLEAVGAFDPALDVGTATDGGGDLDMFFRVLKHGRMLAYDPGALVWHVHRRGHDELVAQVRGWGAGMSSYLARTARAYPDERLGRRLLELRKLAVWFGGRLAASYVSPRFRRDLVLAELRESLTGASRYARALDDAAAHARRAGATLPAPPSPHRSSRAGRARGRLRDAAVELADPPAPLSGFAEGDRVRVAVTRHGRAIGTVTLPAHEGVVGGGRLRDLVARELGPALVGLSWGELRREALHLVRGRAG